MASAFNSNIAVPVPSSPSSPDSRTGPGDGEFLLIGKKVTTVKTEGHSVLDYARAIFTPDISPYVRRAAFSQWLEGVA